MRWDHPGSGMDLKSNGWSLWKKKEKVLIMSDSLRPYGWGSSVHGILQAKTLEWAAIPFSRDLPTQGSNLDFPHYEQILYHLSHQGIRDLIKGKASDDWGWGWSGLSASQGRSRIAANDWKLKGGRWGGFPLRASRKDQPTLLTAYFHTSGFCNC